jgi:hypothetical protein
MNFKKTLQILSKDIEEIEKILDEIDISSPASRIEMRLAVSKLKNLRENFTLFGDLLEETTTAPPPPVPPAPKEEPAAPPPQAHTPEEEKEEPVPAPSPEKTEQAEERQEPPAEERQEAAPAAAEPPQEPPEAEPADIPEKSKSTHKSEGKGKKVRLSDTLHASHEYRNEQLGREHSSEDLSSRLSRSAVTDLRKIINLNEKFMFIRDLFDGDKQRYEDTIRRINEATSRRQAEEFLSGFRWDKKSEAAQRFLELTQRKLKSLNDG